MWLEYAALLPLSVRVLRPYERARPFMAARNSGTALSWFPRPTVPPYLPSTRWKNLFSFGSRLQASILRGLVADLLLERFRNTEISGGR